MNAILFEEARPVAEAKPTRSDIPCFIGFIQRRERDGGRTAVPGPIRTWLQENGWRPQGQGGVPDDDALFRVPVPVESFEIFHALFAWETRPGADWATWLGAAVRSFFAQGGAKCFVVRAAEAFDYETAVDANVRQRRLQRLIPAFDGGISGAADRRETWRGIEVLHGLAEAAFVCLPDLPELVADAVLPTNKLPELPPSPEEFAECSATITPPGGAAPPQVSVPACTFKGFGRWFETTRAIAAFLSAKRRDVQAILTLPLAAEGTLPKGNLMELLYGNAQPSSGSPILSKGGIGSAFLQLVHPWLETDNSAWLPGGLEPPDGVFAGVLARTIATQGVHRSVGRQPLRRISGFFPPPRGRDLELVTLKDDPTLIQRVSLLGATPDGARVLSDVTTSLLAAHRPAAVCRLTAALLRAARRLGEEVVFDPSGAALWRKIERRLDGLMSQFFRVGALLGNNPGDAYSVRCDATTMSQNDIDNGRVLAVVTFSPSHPIGAITVVLSLREGEPLTPELAA